MGLEDEILAATKMRRVAMEQAQEREREASVPAVEDWSLLLAQKLPEKFSGLPAWSYKPKELLKDPSKPDRELVGRGWHIWVTHSDGWTSTTLLEDGSLWQGNLHASSTYHVEVEPWIELIAPVGKNDYRLSEYRTLFGVSGLAALALDQVTEENGSLQWHAT
ncbi:hypothetical protein [Paenarthrobacter sp. YJN-5]|uniref:hypothetical protein n=1 Tax=Paenarthrobacter sp. YJN-5 TaxID=2735316 RepID=UPI0018785E7F|nr:hypothetical protein [Paenarthrobacter sp. YJN-5]QOT19292.1 hypothetical protein HMI59_21585 [Paenarthrobacter sp. YJN-5]